MNFDWSTAIGLVESNLSITAIGQSQREMCYNYAAHVAEYYSYYYMSIEAEEQPSHTYQVTNLFAHMTHRKSNQFNRRQGVRFLSCRPSHTFDQLQIVD